MVGLSGLWMPIVLSAVLVFVMSSVIHMFLNWHAGELKAPPQADALADAMRPFNIPPGEYHIPHPADMKEMGSPAFIEKMNKGPVALITVMRNGPVSMGRTLGLWFVYSLAVSVFTAYVTGRTNGAGAHYLSVFRVAGAVAFAGYALAHWQYWVWWGKGTRATITNTIDGLIYALLTAGAFGWLWPR